MALPWGEPLTVEDLEAMPDDGHRYELVDGVLVVTPAPGFAHQSVVVNLIVAFKAAVSDDQVVLVAPFDWVAGPSTLFQPDVLVALRADVGPARLEHPPLLAVEVLSPSTRMIDLGLKRAAFARAGVQHYWLVDPDRPALTALRLEGDAYVEEAEVTGDQPFTAASPFAVTIVPSALLR